MTKTFFSLASPTMSAESDNSAAAPRSQFPDLPPELLSARRRWCRAAAGYAAVPLRRLIPRQRDAFGILTYHRVANDVGYDPVMLNVTPHRFRQQLEGLLKLGYRPRPLRELLQRQRSGQGIPPRSFAIVFDDGYEDIFRHAWPILRRWKVSATIFLATAYLDTDEPLPFAPWSLACPEPGRCLTTRQCVELLSSRLVDFGCHTHTHADFRGRPGDFAEDLALSLDALQRRFGVDAPLLAFPFGYASPELIDVVRRAKLSGALTSDEALVGPATDPFQCGRFGATQSDTPRTLAAKLDGCFSLVKSAWRTTRRSFPSGKTAPSG